MVSKNPLKTQDVKSKRLKADSSSKKDLADRLAPYIQRQEVIVRDLEISDSKGAVAKQSYKVVVKG